MFPKQLLLRELPPEVDVVCTHPMFGPDSGRGSWAGLNFMYEKVRGSWRQLGSSHRATKQQVARIGNQPAGKSALVVVRRGSQMCNPAGSGLWPATAPPCAAWICVIDVCTGVMWASPALAYAQVRVGDDPRRQARVDSFLKVCGRLWTACWGSF